MSNTQYYFSMSRDYNVITFKADESLTKLLKGMPNRSGFIRSAILAMFDRACPFCKGSGVLTPHQRERLEELLPKLQEEDCSECHECGDALMTRQKDSK